jgi:hypothetical protein
MYHKKANIIALQHQKLEAITLIRDLLPGMLSLGVHQSAIRRLSTANCIDYHIGRTARLT